MTIHDDISIDEYHDQSVYSSHSRIRDYAEKGARYYYDVHVARTQPRETTEALRFGQAFEILYQQGGDAFAKQVVSCPAEAKDGRTVKGREFRKAMGTRVWTSSDDYANMLEMCASLRELEEGEALTRDATPQLTLRGEVCGVAVQARPDYVVLDPHGAYSVDLKSTRDLSELTSARGIIKYGYHTQAALVRRLLAANGYPDAACYLLCAEKEYPHRSTLIRLRSELLDYADKYLDKHLPRIHACTASGTWPRAEPGIVEMGVPRWASEEAA